VKKILVWIFIILGLVVICLLAIGVFSYFRYNQGINSRPLVLIHNPSPNSIINVQDGSLLHATAQSERGLSRLEIWVNNILLSSQKTPQGSNSKMLALSAGWFPQTPGKHIIIARAVSKDGVEGQASMQVEVTEDGTGVSTHQVQEGETLESIADAYGVTEEEIRELNGNLADDRFQPGDEVIVPSGGGEEVAGSDVMGASGDDSGAPPAAGGEAPGSIELMNLLAPMIPFQPPAEQLTLTAEILSLETQGGYENLHCYSSLGGSDPRWLPDADSNQTTDETFASTANGHNWNVADYMAGENAIQLNWVEDQAIPIDISCVGITNGGLVRVKLGRVQTSITPEQWGIRQEAVSRGGDGRFRIAYLVSGGEKGLDPSITPPWNVRIDEQHHLLQWDYFPEDDIENPIDGFAIILNDTFQWTEPASSRQTRLPAQWFNLPCGDEYRFQVVAFRQGYPDGDYSNPSNTAAITGGVVGEPGCGRSVVVTFERLLTGDVENTRPVTGSFFANDQVLSFNGRASSPSFGLEGNEMYPVGTLIGEYGDGISQTIVELPPGRAGISELLLWVGFDVYKDGRKICAGDQAVAEERLAGNYSGTIVTSSPAGSLPDMCWVTYSIAPVDDAPVVEAGAPPPLPDLSVENLSTGPTGQLRIHVRNIGQASWVENEVVAKVVTREGEDLGIFTWPNMTLEPGEKAILIHSDLVPHPAFDACVVLDPNHAVQEERDRLAESGVIGPDRVYCRPLPDLSISDEQYDREDRQLQVTVQNRGEMTPLHADSDGSLENEDLLVQINVPDGRPINLRFDDLNLGARDNVVLSQELTETERDRMKDGYTVVVNPNNDIAELDSTNNSYSVEGTAKLRLVWAAGYARFCPTGDTLVYGENVGGRNTWHMDLEANVSGAGTRREMANWTSPEFDVRWNDHSGEWCRFYTSDWFEVAGDETLTINPSAGLDIVGYGYRWFSGGSEALTAENDFGGTTHVPPGTNSECFTNGLPFTIQNGAAVCGPVTCSVGNEGVHQLGRIEAASDDITGYCWWSTTYAIYREDE
jgi:hypothetical protein